jgi:hypothetical protein
MCLSQYNARTSAGTLNSACSIAYSCTLRSYLLSRRLSHCIHKTFTRCIATHTRTHAQQCNEHGRDYHFTSTTERLHPPSNVNTRGNIKRMIHKAHSNAWWHKLRLVQWVWGSWVNWRVNSTWIDIGLRIPRTAEGMQPTYSAEAGSVNNFPIDWNFNLHSRSIPSTANN